MKTEFTIKLAGAPLSEVSPEFMRRMTNASAVSYHKYGLVSAGFGRFGKIDAIASVLLRLARFIGTAKLRKLLDALPNHEATGNTEMLVDGANFLMFRYMFPRRGETFQATDSSGSPGRVSKDGEVSQRRNDGSAQEPECYSRQGD